jgi:hypothetical protein
VYCAPATDVRVVEVSARETVGVFGGTGAVEARVTGPVV